MSLRFKKPKERIKVAKSDQGLRMKNKKVFVKGKKRRQKSVAESLAFLQQNEEEGGLLSTFPESDVSEEEKEMRTMARKNKKKPKKKKGGSFGGLSNNTKPPRQIRKKTIPPKIKSNHYTPPPPKIIPKKAPVVTDSDSEDFLDSDEDSLPSDFDFPSSDDDLSSISSFSSGLSSLGGKKTTGPRHISLDDSMSIISGQGKSKKKKNAFNGLSKRESEEAEKNDLLARFHILKQRGVHLSKKFTDKSSLNEMRMEMGRIEHENNVAKSIQINRRFFMASTSALTKVTDNYAPNMIRGRWHGFDKYVLNSINDYDEPFERLSEHYGGVIGAITGGNPLWEIFVLFAYQFVSYGFMSDGGEQAKASEDMTADELKKRFPNLLKEAVDKEMNKKREEELTSLRETQFQQRAQFEAFDAQQHRASIQVPPINQIRPPSTPFYQLYPQTQQMQTPQLHRVSPQDNTTYQPQQNYSIPSVQSNLNAENPDIARFPSMTKHEPHPPVQDTKVSEQFTQRGADVSSHIHDMDINMNTQTPDIPNIQPPINTQQDPYMFNEMLSALPQITDDKVKNNIEDYDISESDDEILNNPIGTRDGRPASMNKPPPNKRDENENETLQPPAFISTTKPSPEQVKATRENGYVININ